MSNFNNVHTLLFFMANQCFQARHNSLHTKNFIKFIFLLLEDFSYYFQILVSITIVWYFVSEENRTAYMVPKFCKQKVSTFFRPKDTYFPSYTIRSSMIC